MARMSDLGLQADPAERTAAVLPVIATGGAITATIFAFPGGRRFHFRDVEGHELAAIQLRYRSVSRGISSTKLQGL